ncbi:acetylxylan esterase [Rhodothermus bifroesti]|uniref:Acetylxylan esterase n=1 Tax=Rhodothermus marinus TaxID=29549 RepID=A0A7V2F6P4_RHOMR|nr:acetylxylan esterase [Rhodothermus bifroesti]GBD00348.1 Multidomain esterase [bacterium HR18]
MHRCALLFIGLGIAIRPALAQRPDSAMWLALRRATQEDYQRMLRRLGIDSLRAGPSPAEANTDESKVPPYTLPDPLRFADGSLVTTAQQWWEKRRPEILEDFDREVYGRIPPNVPPVQWEVVQVLREKRDTFPVVIKKLKGRVDNTRCPSLQLSLELTLSLPTTAQAPVPVILHFGFAWPPWMQRPAAEKATLTEWQRLILMRGWGFAELIPTSYQPDYGAGLTEGIIGLTSCGQSRKPDDWGALRAWAWGASRAMDYFETDPDVDATRIAIEGLSRYGKAALVAMAYDQRFAIGFIGSSGAGGAKLLRRRFGEQIENLASAAEYHWFAGNFLKYAGPLTPNDLPVDAHMLIALVAPRPIFIGTGSPEVEGHWVDARGMFLAAVHAEAVYRLLGKTGLGTDVMPPVGILLDQGEIAFRMHEDGHTNDPNWPYFLEFASRYFQHKPAR